MEVGETGRFPGDRSIHRKQRREGQLQAQIEPLVQRLVQNESIPAAEIADLPQSDGGQADLATGPALFLERPPGGRGQVGRRLQKEDPGVRVGQDQESASQSSGPTGSVGSS